MARNYLFLGRVHPERTAVTIDEVSSQILMTNDAVNGALRYAIQYAQVRATFASQQEVQDPFALRAVVEDAVRIHLDIFGFSMGCGYDLELTHMVELDSGSVTLLGVGVESLYPSSESDRVAEFHRIHGLFADARGRYAHACLADLREALRCPADTGFFCYRALETMRQFFADEAGGCADKASWEALRNTLGVERDLIDRVKEQADPARHGRRQYFSTAARVRALEITWDVFRRFVDFASSGYQTKPTSE